MKVFDEIPDFRAWVEKLLSVAPMERRSWKYLSHRFGWKVKIHGIIPFNFLPFFRMYLGISNFFLY